jgi:hypothetical protein
MNEFDPIEVPIAREVSRRLIALTVLGIFAFTIVGSFASIWFSSASTDDISRVAAPVVTVVGTVLGFYFGSKETD